MAEYEPKKGADAVTPTPSRNYTTVHQINYNKLMNLSLGLTFISMLIIFIAYIKGVDKAVYMGAGVMFTSLLFQFALNPIDKEDE